MWGKLKHQLVVAYIVVTCIWLYVIIFVAVTVSIHTRGSSHYETPTPVSLLPCRFFPLTMYCDSTGAGLAMVHGTMQNALPENTYGFGSRYLRRSLPTSHYSSGHEVISPSVQSIGGKSLFTIVRITYKVLILMIEDGDP
jgi:hypothetical protein